MNTTIEKILGYPCVSEYNIGLLRKGGFYNGTGADGVFFDDVIELIFKKLRKANIFKEKKALKLRKDIEQLVVRHDIDTGFKIGFFKANRRLAYGLYKLLHKFPWKYRLLVSLPVFWAVHCTKKARKNYFNKK